MGHIRKYFKDRNKLVSMNYVFSISNLILNTVSLHKGNHILKCYSAILLIVEKLLSFLENISMN